MRSSLEYKAVRLFRHAGTVTTVQVTIAIALAGVVATARQVPTDFTLDSALKQLHTWGAAAATYNEYRWAKEVKDLENSLVGSTIALKQYRVASSSISVAGGKARSMQVFTTAGLPGKVRSTQYYSTDFVADWTPRYPKERLDEPRPLGWPMGGQGAVQVELLDSSDRMALELNGTTAIDVVGRIQRAGIRDFPIQHTGGFKRVDWIERRLYLVVDVTTWSPSR